MLFIWSKQLVNKPSTHFQQELIIVLVFWDQHPNSMFDGWAWTRHLAACFFSELPWGAIQVQYTNRPNKIFRWSKNIQVNSARTLYNFYSQITWTIVTVNWICASSFSIYLIQCNLWDWFYFLFLLFSKNSTQKSQLFANIIQNTQWTQLTMWFLNFLHSSSRWGSILRQICLQKMLLFVHSGTWPYVVAM